MPANLPLELRQEFRTAHMPGTAIELRNKQSTGWAQREPSDLLRITYPTGDVERSIIAVSTAAKGKPIVFLGQRGRGKSHIMALLHHAFASADAVQAWARDWGTKPGHEALAGLTLQKGFQAISETISNQEYGNLWELIFERHTQGGFFKGKHAGSGNAVPAKSLMEDMFAAQPTALILDEFQTWFDGLHDEVADTGHKRKQWAFNFIQILSEIAKERPDLLILIVSVRDTSTEGYLQINRISPLVIDFKGESAKEDRRRLLLHRLFENRDTFSLPLIEQTVGVYAKERVRLLYESKPMIEQQRLGREVAEAWPFSPELLLLLEDHILMASAAQDKRDMIRILAELYRARGAETPVLTASDFLVDVNTGGVQTLIDSFAVTAEQEGLRAKAIHNLEALTLAGISSKHARPVISGIWMRSLSASNTLGATRQELQLDLTRTLAIDDNALTAELASIVESSFNIHEVGAGEKRFCFKLEENPTAKVKANAKNDKLFEPEVATPPGLLPVKRDQLFLRDVLQHLLRPADSNSQPPVRVIVLDPNWEFSPWANVESRDHPDAWIQPVLLVLPVLPADINATLGRWLAKHVPKNRNMVRFLLPKPGQRNLYDDNVLRHLARCTSLAKDWKDKESVYGPIYTKFHKQLQTELGDRLDTYAVLHRFNFPYPELCTFHTDRVSAKPEELAKIVETSVKTNYFAPEDFEVFIIDAAGRGDTMKRVMELLREPPLPTVDSIPYLGDTATQEQTIRIVAKDKIALNKAGTWYRAEAGESEDDAYRRLRSKCFCTGKELEAVQLGMPNQVAGGGVAAPAPVLPPLGVPPGPGGLFPSAFPPAALPVPAAPLPGIISAPSPAPLPVPTSAGELTPAAPLLPQPAAPVIRQSLGAKTGINLLGDIERWGLPDNDRITVTSLVFREVSVKELRDLCARFPTKLVAELQITLPAEQPNPSGGGK